MNAANDEPTALDSLQQRAYAEGRRDQAEEDRQRLDYIERTLGISREAIDNAIAAEEK